MFNETVYCDDGLEGFFDVFKSIGSGIAKGIGAIGSGVKKVVTSPTGKDILSTTGALAAGTIAEKLARQSESLQKLNEQIAAAQGQGAYPYQLDQATIQARIQAGLDPATDQPRAGVEFGISTEMLLLGGLVLIVLMKGK